MSHAPGTELEAWESEGGALERPDRTGALLGSTEDRLEWAVRIQDQRNEEFDRVVGAFRVVVHQKETGPRNRIGTIITVLEQERSEGMCNEEAGFFIRGWQDIGEQE